MSGAEPTPTYRAAGVDQEAADALVPVFAELAAATRRPEVGDEIGGFGGIFSLEALTARGLRRPALVTSTDGVGTKVELLRRAGLHRVAGWDAVAMNVDDVVCSGAEPLLVVDYLAVERLDPGVVREIVSGVADACVQAGCALVGGETSQHPGLLPPDGYDVVATCVGLVDLERAWGPHRVRAGDRVVGLAASGPHANGFSLIRRIAGDAVVPDDLLAPTAIYAKALLALGARVEVHAAAHVTGGGILANLGRALPSGLGATLRRGAWREPGCFGWIAERGVPLAEMEVTFNMGLGMLVVAPDGDAAVRALDELGVESAVVGDVEDEAGVRLA